LGTITWTGRGLALISVFFWGAGYIWAKIVMTWLPPFAASGARYGLASALMLLLAVRNGNPMRTLSGHWFRYLLLGFVGITCFQGFLFSAIQLTSVISASIIMALTPALTALGAAVFSGERLTRRTIVGTIVAGVGAVIAVLGDNPRGLAGLTLDWGEPLALVAALCMAFYTAAAPRLLRKDVAVLSNTAIVITIGAMFLSPLAASAFPSTPPPSAAPLAALAAVAVGSTVIAYLCWNRAITLIGVMETNMTFNCIPVVTMVLASIQGELPWREQLVGVAIVVAGVSWSMLPTKLAHARGTQPVH
jgi:drug/metabolite transporter (DMT)-like permease